MIRRHFIIFLVTVTTLAAAPLNGGPTQAVETKSLEIQPGDTLVIENDYGRVRLTPWNQPSAEIKVRKIVSDEAQLGNVTVVINKVGKRLFIQSYFYNYQAEAVYLDIQVPAGANAIIWGANPAVEVSGLEGSVRVQTLTGFITAENLTSSASLLTEQGNILYRSSVQPEADIRLETFYGNVTCQVGNELNMRGWLRAGRTISWNGELELNQGYLEKQIGVGGPLLLATSGSGNVTLKLEKELTATLGQASRQGPTIAPRADRQSPTPTSVATDAGNRTEFPSSEPYDRPTVPDNSRTGRPAPVPVTYSPSPSNDIPSSGGYSLKVNVDLVYLNASVRDQRTNRAVPNLRRSDFLVYEDGQEQRLDSFDSTEAPFNLLLLLDVSGSTKSYISMIKQASIGFTRQIKPNDRIALATFNSRTRLRHDFTNDRQNIADSIRRINSGGGTAFYDALDDCMNRYMDGQEGRKAIVVFTDGVDNQLTGDYSNGSQINFRDLYRQIQEADILIYTIFLDTENEYGTNRRRSGGISDVLADIILGRKGGSIPGIPGRGDPAYAQARKELEQIADQTGGRMYAPRNIQDLGYVYDEIANDLRIQYTLGYHSSDPTRDGKWRDIRVQIVNRSDLAVRARRGYYAARD